MDLLITVVIIGLIAFIGLIFYTNSKRHRYSTQDHKRLKRHWENILEKVEDSPKQAILEADKILDEALKLKGYKGSLGEKLKKAGPLFTNINAVWRAHKLRNRIAHELDIRVTASQAKLTLRDFQRAFKDLGLNL